MPRFKIFLAIPLLCVPVVAATDYTLVFEENFNSDSLNTNVWSKVPHIDTTVAWRRYVTTDDDLFEFRNGCLVLKGTKDSANSSVNDYRCGAVWSQNKYSFQYGKVEIRAKFNSIQGVWPALWMMPSTGPWPSKGEIDIMEHLNYEGSVYQTLHYWNSSGNNASSSVHPDFAGYGNSTKNDFNTYGIEWTEDSISFYLNDIKTATYSKSLSSYWPFDDENNKFFLILSMQIGGGWVEGAGAGGIDSNALYNTGSEMLIDYVRVWQPSSMIPDIPEPSHFGVGAALAAIAFAAGRRRRR
ncbi:MAG: glycoside hydrolase family 16 protein [Opitutales bacterium]|nr:glycoside hydrolase family 16 protein [Opitutales bacterium]